MKRNVKRIKVSFRLSEESKQLLEKVAQRLGISQTAVLEQSLRLIARHEGISE